MTVEVRDAGWLIGFLSRHVSRSFRRWTWEHEVASKCRLFVTVGRRHVIEMHDDQEACFRLVYMEERGLAWVEWNAPHYYMLTGADSKRLTFDVRRVLRRHGLLTPASQRRTA